MKKLLMLVLCLGLTFPGCFGEEDASTPYYGTLSINGGAAERYDAWGGFRFSSSLSQYVNTCYKDINNDSAPKFTVYLPDEMPAKMTFDQSDNIDFEYFDGSKTYTIDTSFSFEINVTAWSAVGEPVEGNFYGTLKDGSSNNISVNGSFYSCRED